MAKVVTPSSTITDGQIKKASQLFGYYIQGYRRNLSSISVQELLGFKDLRDEFIIFFEEKVRQFDTVVRRVKVDYFRSLNEVLDATGHEKMPGPDSVDSMPLYASSGQIDIEVHLFRCGHYEYDIDLAQKYQIRGLKPADVYQQAAVMEAEPGFGDTVTHWIDANGWWNSSTFRFMQAGTRYSAGHYAFIEDSRTSGEIGGSYDEGTYFVGIKVSDFPEQERPIHTKIPANRAIHEEIARWRASPPVPPVTEPRRRGPSKYRG